MSTLGALENVQKPRRQTTSCGETQKQIDVPGERKETLHKTFQIFFKGRGEPCEGWVQLVPKDGTSLQKVVERLAYRVAVLYAQ